MNSHITPSDIKNFLHKNKLPIFLFHGVIKKQEHKVRNYSSKHIEEKLFDSYMKELSDNGNALAMKDVLKHLTNQEPFPSNSFAITFDDGFENNLSIAGPILEKYEIPAMIYLTTDFINANKMSWIDRIEYAVEHSQIKEVQLSVDSPTYSLHDITSKIRFLDLIRKYVKNTSSCDPYAYAEKICEQLNVFGVYSSDDPLDKKLSWDQIKELSQKNGILSFGGHSHTHRNLNFLCSEDLKNELDTSLSLLKCMGGVDSTHYSYPEGLLNCFSQEVIQELKLRKVLCCPTAIYGFNEVSTDPFNLHRIMIG
jgi:peptidoglycan/xylan/chitin deacetylase (PgdA/CDA1 family)